MAANPIVALGVDPGTRNLGWGVVAREGNRLRHVAHGVIRLDGKKALALRLTEIEAQLSRVVEQHRPEVGSVETLFFHKDAQAAAKLGHARGVVLFALARAGVEVVEYAPARVKRTITGRGQADKRQVGMMIRAVLGLDELPASDASDALALAVTHLRVGGLARALAVNANGKSAPSALAALISSPRRRRRSSSARRPTR
jgi:crossover junction endodeoxyribonuclease RuvC